MTIIVEAVPVPLLAARVGRAAVAEVALVVVKVVEILAEGFIIQVLIYWH